MENSVLVLILTCVIIAGSGAQVAIVDVRLMKNYREHSLLNLGDDDLSYTLECLYTAPRGSVSQVAWSLEGYEGFVYTWDAKTKAVNVAEPLLRYVETDSEGMADEPSIHFKTPKTQMSGLYTCAVFHTISEEKFNPVVSSFDLKMYYFDSTPFKMTAQLNGCNILWSYSTNNVYPKPEVTCGFWNAEGKYSLGTVSGGLIYHQMLNGSWNVVMKETLIEVKEVPKGSLFYCDMNLPIANHTKHTLLEKNSQSQDVYEAIDDDGCSASLTKDPEMEIRYSNCKENCRGECHPRYDHPVLAELQCAKNYLAYWPSNNTVNPKWQFEVTCGRSQRFWHDKHATPIEAINLPYCMYGGGASSVSMSVFLFSITFLLVNKLFV